MNIEDKVNRFFNISVKLLILFIAFVIIVVCIGYLIRDGIYEYKDYSHKKEVHEQLLQQEEWRKESNSITDKTFGDMLREQKEWRELDPDRKFDNSWMKGNDTTKQKSLID